MSFRSRIYVRWKHSRLHKRSLRLERMQIFPNLSNACTLAEWGKQPNAIERHLDSIVTNRSSTSPKCTPNTLAKRARHDVLVLRTCEKIRKRSSVSLCDDKENPLRRRHRRRRRRAMWEMGAAHGKGRMPSFLYVLCSFSSCGRNPSRVLSKGP